MIKFNSFGRRFSGLTLLAFQCCVTVLAADGVTDFTIDPSAGRIINVPGSYRLAGDVTMSVNTSAITINADDVTIDLGGHTLTGTGSGAATAGINASDDTRVLVFNGRVRNFSGWGVLCGTRASVRNVTAENNNTAGSTGGIQVGQDSIVSQCIAVANNPLSTGGTHGIRTSTGCIISDCVASDNIAAGAGIAYGIYAINNCVIRNNVCDNNDSNSTSGTGSAYGIRIDSACVVVDNVCTNQTEGPSDNKSAAGIYAIGEGNRISGNTCSNNTAATQGSAAGIWIAGANCRVELNVCQANTGGSNLAGTIAAGIYVDAAGASVEQNTCHSNTLSATQAGILVSASGDESNIVLNRTRGNGPIGIRLLVGSDGGFFGQNFTLDTHVDDGTNTEGTGAQNNWP